MKRLLIIGYLWLCLGFALGAFILLVPVRRTVDYVRAHNWSAASENMVVAVYILLLAVISFLLARYFARQFQGATSNGMKAIYVATPLVAAGVALYIFMHPEYVNADTSKETSVSTHFTIGPYPDAERMKELKRKGYTGIITLLHPAVVPFEPKLLGEEIAAAKEEGIEVVQISMLPWVSDNTESIDSLRRMVRHCRGHYYVHCYLGKDRVNVARRIIEQETTNALELDKALQHRSMDDLKTFERGGIVKLEDKVYVSPMPTKEEYFGYIIATNFQHVVSLTDMTDPEGIQTMETEKKWTAPYKIAYTVFDINEKATDERIRSVVDSVKVMPRPILIHAFRTDQPVMQRFIAFYQGKK